MRKFVFKFEVILKQRKAHEEIALRQLAAAQQAYQQAIKVKSDLQEDLKNSLIRRENLGNEPVGIAAFKTEQDFITGIKFRIIRSEQGVTRAMRGVEKALRYYLQTRRQTQVMERLKEKHYRSFKQDRNRKDALEVDDISVMRSHLKIDEEEVA